MLHFLNNNLQREFIPENTTFSDFYCQALDFVFNDLNETYEFLKFELNHIDHLIKQNPEIYCILIEKISLLLINLTKNPEISLDEKNLIVFQAKFAEFFNCAFLFLSFPVKFQKRKKFQNFIDDKKKNEFIVFSQNYCLQCGRKIAAQNKIFSVKREFNIIMCKDCEYVNSPYYVSDDDLLNSDWEIDLNIVDLCISKIDELKNVLKNKIKEEIELSCQENNFVYLDDFFKKIQFIVILILSNIFRDL